MDGQPDDDNGRVRLQPASGITGTRSPALPQTEDRHGDGPTECFRAIRVSTRAPWLIGRQYRAIRVSTPSPAGRQPESRCPRATQAAGWPGHR